MSLRGSCPTYDRSNPIRILYIDSSETHHTDKAKREEFFSVSLDHKGKTSCESQEYSYQCSKQCTTGVGIDNHKNQDDDDPTIHKVPLFIRSEIISEKPDEHEQECTHCVRTIEYTLESAYIGAIYPMENRWHSSEFPRWWIPGKSHIEEEIFRKWILEQRAYHEHCTTRDNEQAYVVWYILFEKTRTMVEYPENNQKGEIIAPTIDDALEFSGEYAHYDKIHDIDSEEDIDESPSDMYGFCPYFPCEGEYQYKDEDFFVESDIVYAHPYFPEYRENSSEGEEYNKESYRDIK